VISTARPIRTGRLSSQVGIAVVGIVMVLAVLTYFARTAVVAEVADYGGAYVEGLAGFPQALNPVLANDEASLAVNALVFSGLTKLDDKGLAVPDLAESWEVAPDGKSYTFHLRQNVRWQDGQPVSADDVLYTVKIIQDAEYTGPLGQFWKDIGVEKVDDRTVKLTLNNGSYAPFIEYTTVGLLPAHVLGEVGARDLPAHRFSIQPLGTGPYRVKDVRADRIVLEAAPTYYGSRPHLSRIIFRIYPNHKTILTALERDEVEGVPMVEPEDAARLAGEHEVTVYTAPQASLTLLFFNLSNPLLADRNVRQAIASAVDRQKLVDSARVGRAKPAPGPVLPGSWAYSAEAKTLDYDPERAKGILDRAGWKLEGDSTVRTKDGRRLRFVLLTNDRRERLQLAEALQQQLGAVGIEVEVQATGAGGLVQDFLLPRRYEMALFSWDLGGFDPDPYALWHSSQMAPNGLNVSGFANRRADDLMERARRAVDQGERTRYYAEFQSLFGEEVPSLPLYYPTYDFAVSRKIKGVLPGVMASPADRFRNVVDWYALTRREVVARR
jgi:peptide/nickel transport system substrate-binding protein